jgi:hypothetical protein
MQSSFLRFFLIATVTLNGSSFALAQKVPPYDLPVLVINFFPTNGDRIDLRVTGDVGGPVGDIIAKTRRQTTEVINALEDGSRYHGYKDSNAAPSLRYRVLDTLDFFRPLPTYQKPGHRTPMTDYRQILSDVGIQRWVEEKGVREVWIWAYHGGKVDLWESNMSSPYGDISNSDRDPNDLPVLKHTYTVYHYNYQRGTSEAVEDHMHQIEAVLNNIDDRDRTPANRWPELLFWGKFVGSDRSHKIVRPGCGWAHYPPNGEKDYDWANPREVLSDIEDWHPDGTGRKQPISSQKWGRNSLKWFVYWMQNLPGQANGLSYNGSPLHNWWIFLSDYDYTRQNHLRLVEDR